MINIDLVNNYELYTDSNKCLEFLRNINTQNYQYPNQITNFHVYSEIRSPKELMVIKSYLATQSLDHTQLILWSDYDISNNELLKPYKDYITLKVYNSINEAKDTLLEGQYEYLKADDNRHWMSSGVLRFLVTHKYGGIWADMDIIFFRNLKPILDQEFAYMWGSELDFINFGPCAAFMGYQKGSKLSTICLEEMLKIPVQPLTTCFDKDLLAKIYQRQPYTVFPSCFFDTEWQLNVWYENNIKHYNPNGLGTQIEKQWFTKPLVNKDHLFREAFCWHWHHTSHKNDQIVNGSKFNIWEQIIDNKLKELKII